MEFKQEEWTYFLYPLDVRLANMRPKVTMHERVGLPAPPSIVASLDALRKAAECDYQKTYVTNILKENSHESIKQRAEYLKPFVNNKPTSENIPGRTRFLRAIKEWKYQAQDFINLYAALAYDEQLECVGQPREIAPSENDTLNAGSGGEVVITPKWDQNFEASIRAKLARAEAAQQSDAGGTKKDGAAKRKRKTPADSARGYEAEQQNDPAAMDEAPDAVTLPSAVGASRSVESIPVVDETGGSRSLGHLTRRSIRNVRSEDTTSVMEADNNVATDYAVNVDRAAEDFSVGGEITTTGKRPRRSTTKRSTQTTQDEEAGATRAVNGKNAVSSTANEDEPSGSILVDDETITFSDRPPAHSTRRSMRNLQQQAGTAPQSPSISTVTRASKRTDSTSKATSTAARSSAKKTANSTDETNVETAVDQLGRPHLRGNAGKFVKTSGVTTNGTEDKGKKPSKASTAQTPENQDIPADVPSAGTKPSSTPTGTKRKRSAGPGDDATPSDGRASKFVKRSDGTTQATAGKGSKTPKISNAQTPEMPMQPSASSKPAGSKRKLSAESAGDATLSDVRASMRAAMGMTGNADEEDGGDAAESPVRGGAEGGEDEEDGDESPVRGGAEVDEDKVDGGEAAGLPVGGGAEGDAGAEGGKDAMPMWLPLL